MILIIDNYDSFTYNLVHIVAEHTDSYKVIRNDDMSVEEVAELNPDRILISPGPGRPADAGITEPALILTKQNFDMDNQSNKKQKDGDSHPLEMLVICTWK